MFDSRCAHPQNVHPVSHVVSHLAPRPSFVTVDGATFGPFLTARSARSWLNEYEEMHLGADGQVAVGRWRSRRVLA